MIHVPEDLWDAVIGKEVSSEKDAKALEVIKSSCGIDLLQTIDINEFKSAQTAWNQLAFLCTPQLVKPGPVLMDDNYEIWSNYRQENLKDLGLWDVVDEEIQEHSKIWEQKNAKALHHIQISCGLKTLPQILDLDSAKAAWERLASIQKVDPFQLLYDDLGKAGTPMIRMLLQLTVSDELRGSITPYRHTILHIATIQQKENVVKDLVKKLTSEDLKQEEDTGNTALLLAACVGNEKIARYIAESCPELLTIGNKDGDITLIVASHFGHKSTVRYLYSVSPGEHLDSRHIALDLATKFPNLASGNEKSGVIALRMLATKPLAFPSGKELVFWKQWIYSRMPVEHPHAASKASRGDPERGLEGQTKNQDMIAREIQCPIVCLDKLCKDEDQMNSYKEAVDHMLEQRSEMEPRVEVVLKMADSFYLLPRLLSRSNLKLEIVWQKGAKMLLEGIRLMSEGQVLVSHENVYNPFGAFGPRNGSRKSPFMGPETSIQWLNRPLYLGAYPGKGFSGRHLGAGLSCLPSLYVNIPWRVGP
ncbi:Ankyrin repeat [Dillenia turbinata]|uniref:Ankyrin repeat n=1 Tax=Dillenia turbinata TaxID=194707 RepID=A0AAN8WCT0_9MAGN